MKQQRQQQFGKEARRGPIPSRALSCEIELAATMASASATFERRLREMVATIQALVAAAKADEIIMFDPETPQSAMIHCYIQGSRAKQPTSDLSVR